MEGRYRASTRFNNFPPAGRSAWALKILRARENYRLIGRFSFAALKTNERESHQRSRRLHRQRNGHAFFTRSAAQVRVSFTFFPERERRWNDQSELPAALSNSRFEMTPAAHKFCIFLSLSLSLSPPPDGARLVDHTLVAKYCAGCTVAINDRCISSVRIIDVPVASIAS